jgi:hypothetical protein
MNDDIGKKVDALSEEMRSRFDRIELRLQAFEERHMHDMKAINGGFRRTRVDADAIEARFDEVYARIERLEERA